jgi:hypothetical protein
MKRLTRGGSGPISRYDFGEEEDGSVIGGLILQRDTPERGPKASLLISGAPAETSFLWPPGSAGDHQTARHVPGRLELSRINRPGAADPAGSFGDRLKFKSPARALFRRCERRKKTKARGEAGRDGFAERALLNCRTDGSAIGLSATDAWGRAEAGDAS